MKTFLKVLGWIFTFIAVVGGPQVMIRNNFASPTLAAEAFWIILAWLSFWGAKRKK
ncbi:MAG: hypothetical protein ACI304_03870 [Lepagella sp.]